MQHCSPSGGGIKTFRDEFNAMSYSNNDGTHDFSGPWVSTTSRVQARQPATCWSVPTISCGLDDYPDTGTEPSAKRSVDLIRAVNAKLELTGRRTMVSITATKWSWRSLPTAGSAIRYCTPSPFSGAMSGHKTFDISATSRLRLRSGSGFQVLYGVVVRPSKWTI